MATSSVSPSAGADINLKVKDNRNETPLHVASTHGRVEVVHFLLENGADIYSEENCGIRTLTVGYYDTRPIVVIVPSEMGSEYSAAAIASWKSLRRPSGGAKH